jgi:hypothetical protein
VAHVLNVDDEPASMAELISPRRHRGALPLLRVADGAAHPNGAGDARAPYRCEADFESTMPLVERYRLGF